MKSALLLLSVLVTLTTSQTASALSKFDSFCKEGQSLRQTIVLVDGDLIKSNELASNTKWTKIVVEVLDALEDPRNTLDQYERVSVYVLDKSTADMAPVFTGCSPNLSADAIANMQKDEGVLDWFVGADTKAMIETRREGFRNSLLQGLAEYIGSAMPADSGSGVTSFASLKKFRNLVTIADGLPRVFVLLGDNDVSKSGYADAPQAKAAGIAEGRALGLDMIRSEVHAIVLGKSSNFDQPYFTGLFLASKARLVSFGGSVPGFAQPPVMVRVFAGTVKLDQIEAPVQLRIASDNEGNLVNSWIETTTGRFVATPFTGKYLCKEKTSCEVKGDGRLMGQAWSPNENDEPEFDVEFGWSGLRYIEIRIDSKSGEVRIFDPKVGGINFSDGSEAKEFKFKVDETPELKF